MTSIPALSACSCCTIIMLRQHMLILHFCHALTAHLILHYCHALIAYLILHYRFAPTAYADLNEHVSAGSAWRQVQPEQPSAPDSSRYGFMPQQQLQEQVAVPPALPDGTAEQCEESTTPGFGPGSAGSQWLQAVNIAALTEAQMHKQQQHKESGPQLTQAMWTDAPAQAMVHMLAAVVLHTLQKKRKEKTMLFFVNLMRSPALYHAAQDFTPYIYAGPRCEPVSQSTACMHAAISCCQDSVVCAHCVGRLKCRLALEGNLGNIS